MLLVKPACAQVPEIQWGELDLKKGSVIHILPANDREFYALRWSGGNALGSYRITRHEEFEVADHGKVRLVVDNSMANFENIEIVNNDLVVFLSDKKDGKNHLYMKKYSPEIKPVGEDIHLASFDYGRGMRKGYFDVIRSKNEKYFAVVWEIPGKGDNRSRYGFKIFNNTLELINEGDYPLPFEPELVKVHSHHISDNGEYFLAMTEYTNDDEAGFLQDRKRFKAVHIYHIAEDGLQDFKLDLDNKRVEAMAMSSDENRIFTITGIYGHKDEEGIKGVFFQHLDYSKGTVLNEGFEEFAKDFITEGWSERAIRKANKREEKGKGEPQLYNYRMREALTMEDGSIVGTLEQYYVQASTYSDSRNGQMSTTYYYYYNDIIAYKIDTTGKFQWIEKIRKYQVSTNDGGPFSSYEVFLSKGNLYFIFNDSFENYSLDGEFLDPDKIHMATYSRKKNVVAIAELNLATGTQKRQTYFDRDQIGAIAVPKLFRVDRLNKQMIIYTIHGRKEKFGRVNYD